MTSPFWICSKTWSGLVAAIHARTEFNVARTCRNSPKDLIVLYDEDRNEYVGNIVINFNAYELYLLDLQPTGINLYDKECEMIS